MDFLSYKSKIHQFLDGKISLQTALKGLPIRIKFDSQDSLRRGQTLVIGLCGYEIDPQESIWRLTHELAHLAQAHRADWTKINWGMDNLEHTCIDQAYFIEQEVAAFQKYLIVQLQLSGVLSIHRMMSLDLRDVGKGFKSLIQLGEEVKVDYDQMMTTLNSRLKIK
jgi:hypothetical protein